MWVGRTQTNPIPSYVCDTEAEEVESRSQDRSWDQLDSANIPNATSLLVHSRIWDWGLYHKVLKYFSYHPSWALSLISPKVSCHLRKTLRASSSTSTKEMSYSCPSKPPSAGEEIALKMWYNQESWQPNFSPGPSSIFHTSMFPAIYSLSMPNPHLDLQLPTFLACRPSHCRWQAWRNWQKSQTLRTSKQTGFWRSFDPEVTVALHCLRLSACCSI